MEDDFFIFFYCQANKNMKFELKKKNIFCHEIVFLLFFSLLSDVHRLTDRQEGASRQGRSSRERKD